MVFEQSKWVWMNGELVRWDDATFHLSAHALHYGSGVFEGIRCYETTRGPAIFRLAEHLDRLYSSAAVYGIDIPFTRDELAEAICKLIAQNEFASCYVRPIVFYGSHNLRLVPDECPVQTAILAWPWALYLGAEGAQRGVRVTVSPWQKFHSEMMPTTAKACGQYLNSVLAVREATARGYDEALLLNTQGEIAEGSGENIFVVSNGRLFTNDERHSILLGITRDAVIEIARDLGYPVETRALHIDDLLNADEAFFTGTATEVAPIREVDGRPIGQRSPGEITSRIQRVFLDTVAGRETRYSHWLTVVENSEVFV